MLISISRRSAAVCGFWIWQVVWIQGRQQLLTIRTYISSSHLNRNTISMPSRAVIKLIALPLTRSPKQGQYGLIYLYAHHIDFGSSAPEAHQKPWMNRMSEFGSRQWLKMGSGAPTNLKTKIYVSKWMCVITFWSHPNHWSRWRRAFNHRLLAHFSSDGVLPPGTICFWWKIRWQVRAWWTEFHLRSGHWKPSNRCWSGTQWRAQDLILQQKLQIRPRQSTLIQ